MPKNIMVKYVGPKRVMHVPFPEDGSFPLLSASVMHEIIEFPRGAGVELTPERAEVLLEQCPGTFKVWGPPIKAVTVKKSTQKLEEAPDVEGNSDSLLEDTQSIDDQE